MSILALVLTQVIGGAGYIVMASSYYQKTKFQIMLWQIAANVILAMHFYFLSGFTGSLCSLITIAVLIGMYLMNKKEIHRRDIILFWAIVGLSLITYYTYDNFFSLFPFLASVVSYVAFLSNKENEIRLAGILIAILWLIYAMIYGSYVAIGFEIFMIITTIIALIKHRDSKNEKVEGSDDSLKSEE